jgi:hypothetical protein
MRLGHLLTKVSRVLDAIIDGLAWIGAGGLAIMVLVVVANVVGRYLFRKPLLGAVEMVGLLTVVVVLLNPKELISLWTSCFPGFLDAREPCWSASCVSWAGFSLSSWAGKGGI